MMVEIIWLSVWHVFVFMLILNNILSLYTRFAKVKMPLPAIVAQGTLWLSLATTVYLFFDMVDRLT